MASLFHFGLPNIADLDSFYYIRLAWLYRTRGVFDVSFPWIEHSMIRELSSSLWYGFGVVLVPFTWFGNLVTGIKLAGVLLTVLAVTCFDRALERTGARMTWYWPFLFLFAAPNVLYQLLMTRPQIVSLALGPLLLAFLVDGGRRQPADAPAPRTRDLAPLFAIGLASAWLHLNFVWLPLLIVAVVALGGWLVDRDLRYRRIAAVSAGVLVGWLARPDPLGAARLLYVQSAQKLLGEGDATLLSGAENLPLSTEVLLRNFIPFASLWGAALLAAIARISRARTLPAARRLLLWSSLALSLVSFLLTLFLARRFYNLWAAFGVIFIASAYTHVLPLVPTRRSVHVAIQSVLVAALAFLAVDSSRRTVATFARSGYPPDMHRTTGRWLAEHTGDGDVVFNVRWSHFSPLFFWNQRNRYVAGLDPIFLYAHDRALYWKFHHIAADASVGWTCGAPVCDRNTAEDVHQVLLRDFKARYVVVLKSDRPALQYFEGDARFRRELETEGEAVYQVTPGAVPNAGARANGS